MSSAPTTARNGARRLVLLDGNNLAYKAYYAMMRNPLVTADGENVSAPVGVHRIINRLIRELEPDYIAYVLEGGSSGRAELFPEYKEGRQEMPEELRLSMPRVNEIVEAMGITVVREQGYEADDVIGTLAVKAASAGMDVVIVTSDKDFVQLIRPGISLCQPTRTAKPHLDWLDTSNAHERLGVPAEYAADYLALVGDSSDNVPGARGIGPKGAVDLIHTFGPVENLLERAHEVPGKRAREAILNSRDAVVLSKKLVTIQVDVPMPKMGAALRARSADIARLKAVLDTMEPAERPAVSREPARTR